MVQNNEVNTAQKNFSGILVSMMEDYKGSKDVSGDKLSAFILNQIEKQKIFETREAAEIATSEIISTIDGIDSNFNEIQECRKQGKDVSNWLVIKVEMMGEKYHSTGPGNLVTEIKTGLMEANKQLYGALFGDGKMQSKPFESVSFEGINKRAIASNLLNESESNALLSVVAMGNNFAEIDENKPIRTIQEFFLSPLNSENENATKKVFATATLIAGKKGLLQPAYSDINAIEASAIADRSASTAKIAYKVAKGEVPHIEAINYVVDRASATLITVVDKNCEKIGGTIGADVGAAIGGIFGPSGAAVGRFVGQIIGEKAGRVIGNVVKKGIEKVAELAKETIGKIWNGACSVASSAWNKVISCF